MNKLLSYFSIAFGVGLLALALSSPSSYPTEVGTRNNNAKPAGLGVGAALIASGLFWRRKT